MSKKIYNWKRFWCPRGGRINLSDGGFLSDPESEHSHYYPQDVIAFEKLVNIPCLVLLGEPGIGKTNELLKAVETNRDLLKLSDTQFYYDELNQYSDETRFISNVFANPNFLEAKKNNSTYVIFLDSLDECKIRIDTISEILTAQLKRNHWSNLYFRITCRTAEWSNYLETALNDIYCEQNVKYLELTPLTRADVVNAINENSIEQQNFFNEIYLKGVQPLTIKPITLNFIIKLFIKDNSLPLSRKEIYDKGLEILIDELNLSRKESKLSKKFSNSKKSITAQRIASLMMLGNRSSICIKRDISNQVETDIFCEDIIGKEIQGNDELEISVDLIEETLNTGLFVLHSANKFGWFHQTVAEFLTAKYLFQKEISEFQIYNLMFQYQDGKYKSIPQLNETIGWYVSFRPDLFSKIIENDIEVLLLSDVSLQDDFSKENFIHQLLNLFEDKKIFDLNYSFKSHYHKLNHLNIEVQLRNIINDKSRNITVRNEAIDIAEKCLVKGLLEDIFQIFSDKAESLRVRVNAGTAINNIGVKDYIVKMKSVLSGDLSDDLDDELKGICLLSLWPNHITYNEIFLVLSPRKNQNFGGNYSLFLYNFHFCNPTDEELTGALRWVCQQESRHNPDTFEIKGLLDEIMFNGFQRIENISVLETYRDAVIHMSKNHDELVGNESEVKFYQILESETIKRRLLINSIFEVMTDPIDQISSLVFSPKSLPSKKDFLWMFEQSQKEIEKTRKRAWIMLSRYIFDVQEVDHINSILAYHKNDSIINEEYNYFIKPIEFGSEEANKEKERYYKYLQPRVWEEKRSRYRIQYLKKYNKYLQMIKDGEIEILWEFILLLSSDPEKQATPSEFNSDITSYLGWKMLSDDEKDLIYNCSKKYLYAVEPQTSNWFGTNTFHRPAATGYKIVRLLLEYDIEFINSLPVEILEKWAPIIISFPETFGLGNDFYYQNVVQYFYDKIPNEMLLLLHRQIGFEIKEDKIVWITKKFELCWDENISNILYEIIIQNNLYPTCFSSLLTDLLDKKYQPVFNFLFNKIMSPIPVNENEYKKLIITCKLLLAHYFRKVWLIIWELINENEKFGKDLFLTVVNEKVSTRNFLKEMSEIELGDLYIWLEEKFPTSEYKEPSGFHFVGPREEVNYFKNYVIEELKQRGNVESENTIENIKNNFPNFDWLNYVLYQAKSISRHKKWSPLKPHEILKMLENKNKRSIYNASDLVNVIVESLYRLETELHGESLPVKFIWNNKPITPKLEGDLSDYIKMFLQKDLMQIVVNREVEIRPTIGEVKGENTDLLIQTFSTNKNDVISVIIEAKGSWNKNLKSDMKEQLKKRYLNDNQCRYGIFLVGWFLCDSWDKKNDYRYGDNPKLKFDEAKQFFLKQAEELTDENYHLYSFVLDCRIDRK